MKPKDVRDTVVALMETEDAQGDDTVMVIFLLASIADSLEDIAYSLRNT